MFGKNSNSSDLIRKNKEKIAIPATWLTQKMLFPTLRLYLSQTSTTKCVFYLLIYFWGTTYGPPGSLGVKEFLEIQNIFSIQRVYLL